MGWFTESKIYKQSATDDGPPAQEDHPYTDENGDLNEAGERYLANIKARREGHVQAVQERRRSNAAGPHNHKRPRSEQERKAIKDQEN